MSECYVCGEEALRKTHETIPYRSLPGTLISGVLVEQCGACGERFEHIPGIAGLDKAIAAALIRKPSRFTGAEFRYLRKYLALSATELAGRMGVRKETLSRWENDRRPVSTQADLLLRYMVTHGSPAEEFPPEYDHASAARPACVSVSRSSEDKGWAAQLCPA